MLRRFNLIGLSLILLLLLPNLRAADSPSASDANDFKVPVTQVTVTRSTIHQRTRVQGVIEAIQSPELKTKVSAEVVRLFADEGDLVKAGDKLALLDDEGFRLDKEAALADITQLQALLENQQVTLRRNKTLLAKKLISQSEVDAAAALVKQTRARINHAKAVLKKVDYQLSHTRIISPISGVVQQRSVSKGDYVNPMSPSSQPLFQIVDTKNLRARLYFPETLSEKIKTGMAVTLVHGGQTLSAQIDHLRPMLETQNRALHALADFNNTYQWKPGSSLTADVVLQQRDDAITVPAAALIRRPAGLVVYRLENNRAYEVVVTTGIREEDQVEILSGLKAGDVIALDGAAYLSNDVAVLVQQSSTGEPE